MNNAAIISVSGIRAIFNESLMPSDIMTHVDNFASLVQGRKFLVGRDTRSTGEVMSRIVSGVLLGRGAEVVD